MVCACVPVLAKMSRLVQSDLHHYLVSSSKSDNKISVNENEVYEKIKHLGDGK